MTTRVFVIGENDRMEGLVHHIGNMSRPFTATIAPGAPRTLSQNALLHVWFDEIARHNADLDATDMKGICHREWGLTIRLRDRQWAWVWEQTGAHLPYEKQCKLLASGVLNVSSGMSKPELTEYMNAIQQRFLPMGVQLTIPEDQG